MGKKSGRKPCHECQKGKEAVAKNHGKQEAEAVHCTQKKIYINMMKQQDKIAKITKQVESLTVNDPITILQKCQLDKRHYRYNQSMNAKEFDLGGGGPLNKYIY